MRILMIDDKKNNSDADFIARTFEEAIEALTQNGPWDILYLDYDLDDNMTPPRTGLTLLQMLRSRPQYIPKKIIPNSADPGYNALLRQEINRLDELYK